MLRFRSVLPLLLCAAATPPAVARAEGPALSEVADTLELSDGAFLRGLILEVAPGSHVTILAPGREPQRIPVDQIRRATRAGQPVTLRRGEDVATPPPAREREPKTSWSEQPGRRVRLEVSANRTSVLQRRIGSDDQDGLVAYDVVCTLPCTPSLPVGDPQPYRIGGYRTDPTPWFPVPQQDATVRAELVGDAWPLWPRASLIGGLFFGGLGGAIWGINEIGPEKGWLEGTGIAVAGLGGALLVTSAVLWLVRPETRLTITPAADTR